ncbi:Gfo/Idh/MocA family protein [Kordiimonas sp. SCSIO 12610]|uniref:Gfo/Idh/MocA family protein n=1 Tax=Kordiimonas sp. SCSIO 12610 TaxID=2829597 RepID=UPI00210CFBF5|nr:Gfo/Idh/MocA family oxidoreductase [Kordiimonas sp. SCSIO 12610]UTW55057.1 Gfo/Idh/MocA family oxidoreductase [Kordiimonas sp. SCSIO 12610]
MLNWAILGTGFISHQVADAVAMSMSSNIFAIAGRNIDALDEMQDKYSPEKIYSGYESVFADPEVDIIYIGLPNHIHHTMTQRAAENGKAVLCEKSLCTNMADASALIECVRKHNVFFVEGLMYLSHPVIRKFVSLLQDGRFGTLKSINGYYAADIAKFANPLGKGTLYNLGCYPVSLMHLTIQTMCGEKAFLNRELSGTGNWSAIDGNLQDASTAVRFNNGVLATLQSSDSYGLAHRFDVIGENGTLSFITNPWLPLAGRNHIRWEGYDGSTEDIYVDADHDAFYHQVKMVEASLSQKSKEAIRPAPRLKDSLEIMAFLTEWEAACLKANQ